MNFSKRSVNWTMFQSVWNVCMICCVKIGWVLTFTKSMKVPRAFRKKFSNLYVNPRVRTEWWQLSTVTTFTDGQNSQPFRSWDLAKTYQKLWAIRISPQKISFYVWNQFSNSLVDIWKFLIWKLVNIDRWFEYVWKQ